jgi:hypothetical protein
MPSLTTQSIGMVGAPLANTSQAAQLSRASQAGVQAGVQQNYNAIRAIHSATQVQSGPKRSVQSEPRAEGVFEEGSEDRDEQSGSAELNKQGAPRINTVA